MNREELLLLIEEAGFYGPGGAKMDRYNGTIEDIERLVKRAMAAQKEACAKICEARYMGDNNREDMEVRRCAADIRKSNLLL